MPVCRVAEAGRVVQDGDAQLFAFDRTEVIDPRGRFTPGVGVGFAAVVDDFATQFLVDIDRAGDADAERAFLGVAELHRSIGGGHGRLEVDPAGFGVGAETHGSLVAANPFAVWAEPVVAGHNHRLRAAFHLDELAVDDVAMSLVFVPKADAVHVAVREPERLLMDVVGLLVGIAFPHGPGAGHFLAGRTDDRPQNRLRADFDQVLREQLAVDFDRHAGVILFDGECLGARRRGGQKAGRAHGDDRGGAEPRPPAQITFHGETLGGETWNNTTTAARPARAGIAAATALRHGGRTP